MEATFNLEQSFFKKDQKTFLYTDKDGNQSELSVYLLNRILALIANKYLYNREDKGEYAEISSTLLNNITSNYRSYTNWLVKNDIIIVDGTYAMMTNIKSKNGKCKGYAFNDIFKGWGRITDIKKDKFDEVTNKDQSYLIQINESVLHKIKRDYKSVQIIDIPIEKEYKFNNQKLQVIDFKSYLSSEINFIRMKNKDTYYNWKSGRLYTNFCQCSKSTRLNNFYFDEKLSNLDIPSSFPLWLAVWLKDHGMDTENYEYRELCTVVKPRMDIDGNFYKNEEGEIKTFFYEDLRTKMNKNRNLSLKQSEDKAIIKCQHTEEDVTVWDRDGFPLKTKKKKCNLKLVEDGWCPLHGYIEQNNHDKPSKKEHPTIFKPQAKEDFQKWLNGDNTRSTLINFIFNAYYGDVQSIVDMNKNQDKKYMYHQLVAKETNFIFNIICARLYEEIPDIKILTCHDQIYFEQRFHAQVEAIWIEELKKVYDQLPSHEEVDYDYEEMGVFMG